ncbi:Cas10/Cmr2 second palm domain-containing protein [Nocardia sp. CA-119907]|uniref:Cas10/Cmr2 second palm domain-containing protein n=1 Tax=Nocardia sp. CA-119907 TaxID=3239973 RepID=UPI003D986F0B
MTNYLDIGVVQIQQWLAQAAPLKGRRGASTMIRQATDPDAIKELIAPWANGVAVNSEQGHIDGVVALTVTDPDAAARVEHALITHLRAALPTATLRSTYSSGPTYGQRVSDPSLDWPAPTPEWPLARPCEWCRRAAAAAQAVTEDRTADAAPKQQALCIDCGLRLAAAGTTRGRRPAPGPERDLLQQLAGQRAVPDDFNELAAHALGRARDNTHVATIYADGNALGRFVKAVAENRPDRLPALPAAIHAATWAAVLAGLAAIDTGDHVAPIIAHLVGGDDILVSVPAHGGWDFTAAMMSAFESTITHNLPGVPDVPTLSAGVVIHHRSFPLSTVIELAAQLLREAKATHPGRAALCWHSVTHDGDQPTDRPALTHESLTGLAEEFAALATVPASQRQELAWLLRNQDTRGEDFTRHLTRLGLTEVSGPFRTGDGVELAAALEMVRWWRQ